MNTLTARGRALLVTGLVCMGAGWGLGAPALVAVAALLALLPIVGALVVRRSRFVLGSSRTVDRPRLAVGEQAEVVLAIENGSRVATGVLLLQDAVSPNLSDSARVVLDRVPAHAHRVARYQVTGLDRGRAHVGPLDVIVTDPFGVASAVRSFTSTNRILVTPPIVALTDAGHSLSPGGRGETAFRTLSARGDDDVLPREHRAGDDMRRIHWRATARHGDLMVRREEQSWHDSLDLILDNRASAHDGHGRSSSFEWAVSAAASICMHFVRAGWQVRVRTTSGAVLAATSTGTSSDVDAILGAFAEVGMTGESMTPGAAKGMDAATAVVAILGRISDDSARALIRPDSGFAGCLALAPAPTDLLTARGWQVVDWTRSTPITQAWAGLVTSSTVTR